MAHVLAPRVGETSITTGTGNYTLAAAIDASYQRFSARMAVGDYCYASIVAVDEDGIPTGAWEEGRYTYTAANTLSRTEIHDSSNGGFAVNWGAGTKQVKIAFTARLARSIIGGTVASNVGTVTPPGGDPGTYITPLNLSASDYPTMTFRDEFDSSSIDAAKWPMQRMWYEPAQYANRGNIDVNGGKMRIWAKPWSSSLTPATRYPNEGGSYKNHNATICTDGVWRQKYGFFEAKIKMPKGKGPFPAFWLYSHQNAAGQEIARRVEIDIVECYTSNEPGAWSTVDNRPINHVCTVWRDEGDQAGYRKGNDVGMWEIDLSADFHVYGCRWDAAGIQFYFDGQPFGTKLMDATMNEPCYILLDYWMGGESGLPNDPPGSLVEDATNSMEIEYVRAWSLSNGSSTTYTSLPLPPQTGDGDDGGVTPPPPPPQAVTRVQFWGDSTVWGYKATAPIGSQVSQTMPEQFATHFPNVPVENRGVNSIDSKELLEGSGEMTAFGGWLDNMEESTASHILVMVGINDAAAGQTKGGFKYYQSYLCRQAVAAGKKFIFLTNNPTSTMNTNDFAQWTREVAAQENAPVIDVYAFCLTYMSQNNLTITQAFPDGIHPSEALYIAIGNYIAGQFPAVA